MTQTTQPVPHAPSSGGESTTPSAAPASSWSEPIELPRWAVYCQAALLGLIATTFFIFGMMVGNLTSERSDQSVGMMDCRVVGSVAYRDDGDLRADDGAVVMLLPGDRKPDVRGSGETVNPDSFQALDNTAIDRIHELGGAIVRADENGKFDVLIDANEAQGREYYLFIVSRNQRGIDNKQMTKEEFASIGTYFSPVEEVVEDRSFYWMKLVADSDRIDLPEIEF